MNTVRRPKSLELVLDLTRRLAEEYDAVPLHIVTSTVRSAAQAVQLFGDDVAASIDTVEKIAREDLAALREAAAESTPVPLAG